MSKKKVNQGKKSKKTWQHYLVLSKHKPKNWGTIKRHYVKWREEQGIPLRCDNDKCDFHTQPLIWCNKKLPLVLDHPKGQKRDNRPHLLQQLCPNCHSQTPNFAGGNKGKVEDLHETEYVIYSETGKKGKKDFTKVSSGGAVVGGEGGVSAHYRIEGSGGMVAGGSAPVSHFRDGKKID
jgi:hypothetical protein